MVSSVGNGLKFHRKFLRAAYLVQFYLFSLLKVIACARGEGSGCSYFGQAYLRPTFTPDYSKSKQTSRFSKEIMSHVN